LWKKEFPNFFEASLSLPSLIIIVQTSVFFYLQLLEPVVV